MKLSWNWLASLVLVVLPAWVYATPSLLGRVPELRATGLSNAQLRSILDAESRSINTSCTVNSTDGVVFPGPAPPSPEDLLKRNSFVTRCAFCPFHAST
jgi:hypothetical protein